MALSAKLSTSIAAICDAVINRMVGALSDKLNPPKHKQVQWIIYVENVFHNGVRFRISTQFSVIHGNYRYGQNHSCLQNAVHFIKGKEVNGSIHHHIKYHPEHLLFQITAVSTKSQDAKAGNTAPIAGKRNQANQYNQRVFLLIVL